MTQTKQERLITDHRVLPSRRGLFAAAMSFVLLAGTLESSVAGDETRREEVERILARAPRVEGEHLKDMRVVLLADAKDHGPAGNGLHDYPLWQERWAQMLGEKDDTERKQNSGSVKAIRAWEWPSDEMFQTADVIVAFCYLEWSDERLAQVRRYLENGGGLVLIHSATWTRPEPSKELADVVGVGGFTLYRHGPVRLDIAALGHPICLGLPKVVTLENDETYWPPTPLADNVIILATSVEEHGVRGSTAKAAQPMFWCYGFGKGRVFGCVPGHRIETFDDSMFRILLLRGIAWAGGQSPYRLDGLVLKGRH